MKLSTSSRRSALAAGLLAALAFQTAAQAQDFPNKPIKWVVPYAAGTAPDQTVRIVSDAMVEVLKQPIVIENRPGAAGNVGAQAVAKAAPDGYTWIYSGSPMSTNMRMYKQPGFDVMKDFIHVGRIGVSELVVVTHPQSGIGSMKDLVAQARKNPGKLSYATGGVGTPAHMAGALVMSVAGADALHVPFKGANESTQAVIGRQVDYALALSTVVIPHIQSGRLLALAVSGKSRLPALPNVPTLMETGINTSVSSFGGLSVPAGTPAPIVAKINDALQRAMNTPKAKERMDALGGQFTPGSGAELTEAFRQEIPLTEAMMRAAKLEAQ